MLVDDDGGVDGGGGGGSGYGGSGETRAMVQIVYSLGLWM